MSEQAAWTANNLADPHAVADKADRVREMFAAIAPSYDLNNRVHSLGRDQAWRRAAVKMAMVKPSDHVLDVACGTGDLTLAFYMKLLWSRRPVSNALNSPDTGQVAGLDFTFDMLPLAQRKAAVASLRGHVPERTEYRRLQDERRDRISWINGDAMALPIADASFDVVSIAFGIRNVAVPAKAISEFYRVLRPGGRLVILEFSLPRSALLRGLYNFYFKHIMPRTATLIARDKSGAYKYLPQSVNTFIDRSAMVGLIEQAGFRDVVQKPLTFGIAVIYRGMK